MKRIFGWFALLALVAIPAVGCGPGEPVIPDDAAGYNESEALNESNSTAEVSLDEEMAEKEGN